MHDIIAQSQTYGYSNYDLNHKISEQEDNCLSCRGSKNLSQTDFASSLKGCVRGQTKESQAGNKNGQESKETEYPSKLHFILILLIVIIFQEKVLKWIQGKEDLPLIRNKGKGLPGLLCIHLQGIITIWILKKSEYQWLKFSVQSFLVKIFQHTHNIEGIASEKDGYIHG